MNIKNIREDFPSLDQRINGKPIVYMDSACMSLKPRQVIEAMNEYYSKYPACGGRSIHKFGTVVTELCAQARKSVSRFIGARKSGEIIFTKNTTEGINMVAHSLGLRSGDIVLTTDREHNSNLLPWQVLAKTLGIRHEIVKSREDMTFDLEGFESVVREKKPRLVSLVHSSNLDGYTIPAREAVKIAKEHGALVMLDGAQSAPHKEINVKKLGVDFFSFSGHKMLGPTGTGVLYGRYDLLEEMEPFFVGGETVVKSTYDSHELMKPPEKFEAGLQNYAGIIGFGEAARYLEKVGRENIQRHETELNKMITHGLHDIEGIKILGPQEPELRGGIISFIVDGMHYHDVAMILDNTANVMVRSGQHCVHSWFNAHGIAGSVRASLYLYNTKEEAEIFLDTMKEIVKLR